MAQLLEIKTRIRSVDSTLKITRAMKMIATARLAKARQRHNRVKPVYARLETMVQRLMSSQYAKTNPLFVKKENERILFVVFSTDRGFCGGYNSKLFNFVEEKRKEKAGYEVHLLPVGQKAVDYFDKYEFLHKGDETISLIWEEDLFNQSRLIAQELNRVYLNGTYGEIHLVYNTFVSVLLQQPKLHPYLPMSLREETVDEVDYLFEPDEASVFKMLLESYQILTLNMALIDLETGEHGARMSAMDGANRNGEKLTRKLKIQYQRARQEAITSQITEIIGGAETLRREKDE